MIDIQGRRGSRMVIVIIVFSSVLPLKTLGTIAAPLAFM